MPPINQAAVSAGVIAVSVAVAAAIAVYESPELRRMADDLRRRIAIALHSLGDGVNPPDRDPLFNRPEDADGFLRSRGAAAGAEAGVEADEESRRRQREELMYWNRVLEEKKEKERRETEEKPVLSGSTKGSTFDDFLQEDKSGEKGTFVFNTGTDLGQPGESLVRRRGTEGVRGLNSALYANPFGDEHGIDSDEQPSMEAHILSPGRDEVMSDIYNATEPGAPAQEMSRTLSPRPLPAALGEVIFDSGPQATQNRHILDQELGQDEYMTAGQDDRSDAYASIQAWAQNSNPDFYSPLPMSPPAPLSEPEVISDGALTPTDSASEASGEDVANDVASQSGTEGNFYDVMSQDTDGIPTPTSWSEIGSTVSESDAGAVPQHL